MRKIISFLILLTIIFSFSSLVLAQKQNSEDLPVIEGIYDVPGRSDLKLRVFVHSPKEKPLANKVLDCLDDNSSELLVNKIGWQLPSIFYYKVNYSSAPLSVRDKLSNIIDYSLTELINASGNKISVQSQGSVLINKAKLDKQSIIAWGRIPVNALAITYTWYNPQTKEAVEIDTIFNNSKKINWGWTSYQENICGDLNSYDVQNVLTHELGHWFGLDDEYESKYINHTMYGYAIKGEIKKDTLTVGDEKSLFSIYNY